MRSQRLHALLARASFAFTAIAATPNSSSASIIYSGIVNIQIPSTTNGLYLNVVTGAYNVGGGTGNTVPGGWHINPWGSTNLSFFVGNSGTRHLMRTGGGAVANVPFCTMVGPSSGLGGWSNANLPALTTGHEAFALNSNLNLYAFSFLLDGNRHYGWARIALSNSLSAQPRYLVEYAYESVPDIPIYPGCQVQFGSCCINNGCTESSHQWCLMNGGNFFGQTQCSSNPCPPPPPPPCPADVAPSGGNGVVDVSDLLAVIAAWGACPKPPPPCDADINHDGAVNVTDLLAVIQQWGPCPQ